MCHPCNVCVVQDCAFLEPMKDLPGLLVAKFGRQTPFFKQMASMARL